MQKLLHVWQSQIHGNREQTNVPSGDVTALTGVNNLQYGAAFIRGWNLPVTVDVDEFRLMCAIAHLSTHRDFLTELQASDFASLALFEKGPAPYAQGSEARMIYCEVLAKLTARHLKMGLLPM